MTHDLDSVFLFIHPPLAVLGFFLTTVLLFSTIMYMRDKGYSRIVKITSIAAWTLSLLGLITGMIWAQIAWGRYWAWDPKETLTLLYFMSLTFFIRAQRRRYPRRRLLCLSILSFILMVLTILISFILRSLHSYV